MEKILLYEPTSILDIGDRKDNDPPVPENINLYKIPNAIITPYGFIIKNLHVFKPTLSFRHKNSCSFINILLFSFFKTKKKISEPALSISFGWYDSYYHFTCECLVKLFLLKDYIPNSILVFPKQIQPFHAQWFKLLGVKNIVYLDNSEVIQTPLAISSEFPARDLNHHSEILPDFSKWVLEKINIQNQKKIKKIFVGRKNPTRRKLLNNDEVKTLITSLGFEYVEMEEMSIEQQIATFHHAEQIISVHGAALSNLIFSKKGTFVLDLCQEDFKQWCFLKLAMVQELKYEFLYCKSPTNTELPGYRDIVVNIQDLKSKIESWNQ
ncbi:MAG: glycosyltransferase family 61 protein [Sphingobacteriaceae bacterium]|nr:glycosyltransferase family 61 protein [Sphingobacteriaceae bacterium]